MNTLLLSVLLLWADPAQETVRYPAKPGPRDFILDEAKLLTSDDAAEIKTLCDEALTRKRAPIIVVTIPSLAAYGAGGWPIERYAMNLMSEWGVGWEEWNYGMLLLVSPGDRKARIELQPRDFRLLEYLMRNAERVVTRTMLLEGVWEFHFDPKTNIVETHMSRLRAKLAQPGTPDLIHTVRGAGYVIRPPDSAADV